MHIPSGTYIFDDIPQKHERVFFSELYVLSNKRTVDVLLLYKKKILKISLLFALLSSSYIGSIP